MKIYTILFFILLNSSLSAATLQETIEQLQKDWAIANFETQKANLENVFEKLTLAANKAQKQFPDSAEILIWKAVIVSSDAGKNGGGLSALRKAKEAQKLLLKAEKINPMALNGSIYLSLGSLYYQAPGWPFAFGDDDQARIYLKKALKIDPEGMDPNFFYAEFLVDQGEEKEALSYYNKALKAPTLVNRPVADRGRRAEITQKLKKLAN